MHKVKGTVFGLWPSLPKVMRVECKVAWVILGKELRIYICPYIVVLMGCGAFLPQLLQPMSCIKWLISTVLCCAFLNDLGKRDKTYRPSCPNPES